MGVLEAIASRLTVRTVVQEQSGSGPMGLGVTMQMYDHKEVSDEVKALFEEELDNHLRSKLQGMEIGDSVDYGFEYGNVRPLGTLMEDANDNLAEVLLKLPALGKGESYEFPYETYIKLLVAERNKEENHFDLVLDRSTASPWIMEALSKQ